MRSTDLLKFRRCRLERIDFSMNAPILTVSTKDLDNFYYFIMSVSVFAKLDSC
uniref:Uncharacterized protein n=1 Tax=Lotus japonicus TaxID=34305 RepID=I3T345_LOTJA|nr:unknown [Lotus japonicus]